MVKKRLIRCKRCKRLLDKHTEVVVLEGYCHNCYLDILTEEGEKIDSVGKELDMFLKKYGVKK